MTDTITTTETNTLTAPAEPPPAAAPGRVSIRQESLRDALNAFDAEKDPRARGLLYCRDLAPRLAAGENMPLTAANSPGTLAGTLVSQRALELLKFTFPILRAITADFSDETAQYNQVVKTRVISIPSVVTYDPATGWSQADQTATDVSVTLDHHVGVPITFDSKTLASTVRRLFDEFAPAAAYALAKNMVDALYALITSANFTSAPIVSALADFDRAQVIDAGVALNLRGVPMGAMNRTLLLTSAYFGKLAQDHALVTLAAFGNSDMLQTGILPDVHGFKTVDAPNLPANDANVSGFAFSKSALLILTRLAADYTKVLPGSSYGNATVVTDPDLNLSVQQVQYVNHDLGAATQRISCIYGVAKGQPAAGQIISSQ